MTNVTSHVRKPAFSPLPLQGRSLGWQTGAVVFGTIILALSSQIAVPMIPVPITMQTLAVTVIGALYGWRLGTVAITLWLIEGAVGLPVLAHGASGAHNFLGTTGGYLFAFPVTGALVGWFAERGWNGNRPILAFAAMLLGSAACLILGAAWLAAMIGIRDAFIYGVMPFVLGEILKSALGAAILTALSRGLTRRPL